MNAEIVLRMLRVGGVGPARVWAALSEAKRSATSLEAVLEEGRRSPLTDDQRREYANQADAARDDLRIVEDLGGVAVTALDPGYPTALVRLLGRRAPPVLFFKGALRLLTERAVGFCGSRHASEKGIATAVDCAEQLARGGINVVSGYAAGVDMATHTAALRSGGTTTVVMAEGMSRFRVKKEIQAAWEWDRTLVVSEFLPQAKWSVQAAMRRNHTICALSRAMILIEAGTTGGSIAAGKLTLELGLPLFAPVYEGMPETASGNRQLLDEGARPLLRSRTTGRANLSPVLQAIQGGEGPSIPGAGPQMGLL